MKYFVRILTACTICFLGVLAGLQFAKGDISIGIVDIFLAIIDIPYLFKEEF